MKTISILSFLILITACNSKESSAENNQGKDTVSVSNQVIVVVGIGKVEPKDGVVDLASNSGGIVASVLKQAGDSVKVGETIIRLQQEDLSLKIDEIKAQIQTQQQQIESNKVSVGQYKAQLQEKKNTLKVSEKLAKSGAETNQNVSALKTDKKVLEVELSKNQQEVAVSRSHLKELQAQLKTAENNLDNQSVKAPSDGISLSIDTKKGEAIQALQSFATFAAEGPIVVHGEADEMFANRLKTGQKVKVHYIGNKKTITTGEIIYLSPTLSNKSLFTDVPGEKQDRRVRRFKVLLDSTDDLLINTKVECNIDLKSNQ